MRTMLLMVVVAVTGCGAQPQPLSLHLEQPMALDWKVGVNGADGYSGVEQQGDTQSYWIFMSSSDQGGAAPQTIAIVSPESDGTVQIRPWWINYKDDASAINCNNTWSGTITTEHSNGAMLVSFDAYCESQSVNAIGKFTMPL